MDREERRKSFVDSMSEEFDTARPVCAEYCSICPHNTCSIKMRREEEPIRTQADIEAAMTEVEEKSKAFTEAHQGESADEILAAMRGVDPAIQDIVDKHFWEMLGELKTDIKIDGLDVYDRVKVIIVKTK